MYNDRDDTVTEDHTLGTEGAKNQGKGAMDKLGGKIQEAAGKVTGNDDLEAKGKMNQAKGSMQQGLGKVEGAVDDAVNP